MKRFTQLLVSIKRSHNIGAYKLLFDNNGLLSSSKSPITTLATDSYNKKK
jgi:hypothetical protein